MTNFKLPVLVLILACCIVIFITVTVKPITNEVQNCYNHIGDTLILNNDTSIIVDYSFFNNSYILYNRQTVNANFANKLMQ